MTESLESTGVWLVHPNATDASNATFAAKTLYLSKSSTGTVGFGGSLNYTEVLTDVWSINGHYVLAGITGANFYARSLGEDKGYILLWSANGFDGSDVIPLTLRAIRPFTNSLLSD